MRERQKHIARVRKAGCSHPATYGPLLGWCKRCRTAALK